MANRRMFSRDVTETDDFLELSFAAQALYVHLCQYADDDGFIAGYRGIIRNSRCELKHLDELITKGLLLSFGSNKPLVISHWLVSNQIRPSRKHETLFTEEKNMLLIEKGMPYRLLTPEEMSAKNVNLSAENSRVKTRQVENIDKTKKGKCVLAVEPPKQNTQTAFVPPTFDEVESYCKEINSPVPPERFFWYYEKDNWEGVRNWKSLLQYWGTYEQRKYTAAPQNDDWLQDLAKIGTGGNDE